MFIYQKKDFLEYLLQLEDSQVSKILCLKIFFLYPKGWVNPISNGLG